MKRLLRTSNPKAAGSAVIAVSFVAVLIIVAVLVVLVRGHAATNNATATTTAPTTVATHVSTADCNKAVTAALGYMSVHSLVYFANQMSTAGSSSFNALHDTVTSSCAPAALNAFLQGPYAEWFAGAHVSATTLPAHVTTTTTGGSTPTTATTTKTTLPKVSTTIKSGNYDGNTVVTSPIPTIGNNGAGTNPDTVPTYPGP